MLIGRNTIKRALLRVHKLGIRLGVHILPVHYYSPIPNILELQRTRDVWARKSELPGLSVNLDEQVSMLKSICIPYQGEYAGNNVYREGVARHFGPGYGYIEAQALHAFIRHYKPKRIVEVGSGVSSYCMLRAAEANGKETGVYPRIVSIEPHASTSLKGLSSSIELVQRQVQTVSLELFRELEENDLLFIDSSHTVKPGGDVNYLILEVLPRLHRGVVVHFHDIYLPYDYQRDVCETFLHWAETSLLRAFLTFNGNVKIIVCLSHLHYDRQDTLRQVFPEYNPQPHANGLRPEKCKPFAPLSGHFPSSIYIQIC
jgi:hypothetical protein